MNEYVKSDLYRYCGRYDIKSFFKQYIKNGAFRLQVAIRLIQSNNAIENKLGKVLYVFSKVKKTIQISPNTKIGYGLYIGHCGPVIINPTAKIGNNVNLSQFVTIGSNKGKAAIIGDNVYIGPSVCIVEDVIIGDNVTIGAGSIVIKDIPENATAVGNYAKVINYKNPARFIGNRWGSKK